MKKISKYIISVIFIFSFFGTIYGFSIQNAIIENEYYENAEKCRFKGVIIDYNILDRSLQCVKYRIDVKTNKGTIEVISKGIFGKSDSIFSGQFCEKRSFFPINGEYPNPGMELSGIITTDKNEVWEIGKDSYTENKDIQKCGESEYVFLFRKSSGYIIGFIIFIAGFISFIYFNRKPKKKLKKKKSKK